MDIEGTPFKKNQIDLEESPVGNAGNLQGIDPCFSALSLDAFFNSIKKEESVELPSSMHALSKLNYQLS